MNNLNPVLLGFASREEREFFDRLTSVEGIGPKAALRALTLPVADVARAIEAGDTRLLSSLPGIGKQRASQIIAKLKGKVTPFIGGPQASTRVVHPAPPAADSEEEALAILLQLGYKKPEAERMLRAALTRSPGVTSAEELIQEVFRGQGQEG
ncbi:MAG: helix-hairpin-helix domain-containing protein [Firmicutes bacterium]|nr:helix-hairpin-helix domain-containing protein [Bacillota bacterium]